MNEVNIKTFCNELQLNFLSNANIIKYLLNSYIQKIEKIDADIFWKILNINTIDDIILFRKKIVEISHLAKTEIEADNFLKIWDGIINWQKENGLYVESIELYDEELKLLHNIDKFIKGNRENMNNKSDIELLQLIENSIEILLERISTTF